MGWTMKCSLLLLHDVMMSAEVWQNTWKWHENLCLSLGSCLFLTGSGPTGHILLMHVFTICGAVPVHTGRLQ